MVRRSARATGTSACASSRSGGWTGVSSRGAVAGTFTGLRQPWRTERRGTRTTTARWSAWGAGGGAGSGDQAFSSETGGSRSAGCPGPVAPPGHDARGLRPGRAARVTVQDGQGVGPVEVSQSDGMPRPLDDGGGARASPSPTTRTSPAIDSFVARVSEPRRRSPQFFIGQKLVLEFPGAGRRDGRPVRRPHPLGRLHSRRWPPSSPVRRTSTDGRADRSFTVPAGGVSVTATASATTGRQHGDVAAVSRSRNARSLRPRRRVAHAVGRRVRGRRRTRLSSRAEGAALLLRARVTGPTA